jgi:hypothetical protein
LKAETDLSTKQFCPVEMSGTNQMDVCDGTGDTVVGVLQDDPEAGQYGSVQIYGVTQCRVNGLSVNIAAGDKIGPAAAGVGVKKTADADPVFGIALEPATADGVIISVLLTIGAQRAS